MKEIALLVDKRGSGDVFDRFAREIEHSYIIENLFRDEVNALAAILSKIHHLERSLQDLSEYINAQNEHQQNVYEVTIQKSRQLLNAWLGLFVERKRFPNVIIYLDVELNGLLQYVVPSIIQSKTVDEITDDFEHHFLLDQRILETYTGTEEYKKAIDEDGNEQLLELNARILTKLYTDIRRRIDTQVKKIKKPNSGLDDFINEWEIDMWIDTKDAAEANKFMYLVASTINYIDDVKIEIIDTKIGSFFQKWRAQFNEWIAKEETKQVLKKGANAFEAYALDKHTEPIEKSKTERKKTDEEIKRMMPEGQTTELHNLTIEEKKEDIRAKKLANIKLEIEIQNMLSERLAKGLMEIDSDFQITINGLLIVKQENRKIEIGNIEDIDSKSD